MKVFHCDHCGQLLFFENVSCGACGRAVAYVPDLFDMASLDPAGRAQDSGVETWSSPLTSQPLRLCANRANHDVCNWALAADDEHALCAACRLTRTIPDLSRPGNVQLWYKLEVAKRRLVYTLDHLGLSLKSQLEDPDGVLFELLEDPDPSTGAPPVLTGHVGGVITINVAEADDAERVRRRVALNEPYRTLLGHFRHESGHHYWDRLVRDRPRLEPFRALFGDERADYEAAKRQHYDAARTDWQGEYISAYATMHPWEDWAETWAHYLHMVDTLEMAAACGMSIDPPRSREPRLAVVPDPVRNPRGSFEGMIEGWGVITYVMNNLNRGLGNDDAYPFVLAPRAIEKLRFVHETIAERARPPRSRLPRR